LTKKCFMCGTTKIITKHHVVPLHVGGIDLKSNIVDMCKTHHDLFHKKIARIYPNPTMKIYIKELVLMKLKYDKDMHKMQ